LSNKGKEELDMKKKTYMQPTIEMVEIKGMTSLLIGSVQLEGLDPTIEFIENGGDPSIAG
jgi:hypothetical protein